MNIDHAKFLMQKTKKDYDEISDEFSATRRTMWPELGDLDKYIKEGDNILDIGCGNGKLFGFLAEKKKNFSYVGLDVSEKLLDYAKNNYLDAQLPSREFRVFDGMNIPYPDNSFDIIFCLATLPHLPGREMQIKFLENIRLSAKSGAKLIITCWNLWQFKFISFQLKMIVNCITDRISGKSQCDWGDFYIPWKKRGVEPIIRYYHAFTVSELNGILLEAGWEVEESGYKARFGKRNFNLFAVAKRPMVEKHEDIPL